MYLGHPGSLLTNWEVNSAQHNDHVSKFRSCTFLCSFHRFRIGINIKIQSSVTVSPLFVIVVASFLNSNTGPWPGPGWVGRLQQVVWAGVPGGACVDQSESSFGCGRTNERPTRCTLAHTWLPGLAQVSQGGPVSSSDIYLAYTYTPTWACHGMWHNNITQWRGG